MQVRLYFALPKFEVMTLPVYYVISVIVATSSTLRKFMFEESTYKWSLICLFQYL